MRARKGVVPEDKAGKEELAGVERGETVIQINCMRKLSIPKVRVRGVFIL